MFSGSIVYGLLSMFGYGILNTFNGRASKVVGAYKLGFLVQLFGFVLTALLFPLFGKVNVAIVPLLLLSFPGFISAITYITFMKAFEKGSISIVMPIVSSWAIITSILSFTFLKEQVHFPKIFGICLTVVGLIILTTNIRELFHEKNIKLIAGAEWASMTAIGWGVNFFLVSFFSKSIGWYMTNIGIRIWVTVTFLVLTPLLKIRFSKLIASIPKIVYLIAVLDVIFYSILNIGLEKGEASIVAVLASAAPVISILVATFIMREKLITSQKIGIVLSLVGIIVLTLPSI